MWLFKRMAFLRMLLMGWSVAFSFPASAELMATDSDLKVTENGSISYSLPITVPPGIGGTRPTLSLNYDSHAGKGMLGTGWSLTGLSVIALCPRTIVQDGVQGGINYDANDRFCLDGQRLVPVTQSYAGYGGDQTLYTTEIDSFSRIKVDILADGGGPGGFEVKTKAGEILLYGGTESVEVEGRDRVRVWPIRSLIDSSGNEINFQYVQNVFTGEFNIRTIRYGGNVGAGLSSNVRLEFIYESRPDEEVMYVGGVLIRLTKRLGKIQTYVGDDLVRQYEFSYDESTSTMSSRLKSIKECATNASGALSCLPDVSFEFEPIANLKFSGSQLVEGPQGNAGIFIGSLNSRRRTVDFNGDGLTDLAQNFSGSVWTVCLSTGGADFSCSGWQASFQQNDKIVYGDINGDGRTDMTRSVSNGWGICLSEGTTFNCTVGSGPADADVLTGDFDGDGRLDLADDTSSGWNICLSEGNRFSCGNWGNNAPSGGVVADVDGDGRSDLLKRTSGRNWNVCRSESGRFSCSTWIGTSEGGPAADFNGDGLIDLADHLSGNSWEICLSTGTGFSCSTQVATNSSGVFGDFNGDGKSDIAQRSSGSTWNVCLSKGVTFVCSLWTGGIAVNSNPILVGDFDGNGKSDLMQLASDTQWSITTSAVRNTDLVRTFHNGIGDYSEITYGTLGYPNIYVKGTGAIYPVMDMQAPVDVVTRVTGRNGIGGSLSTSYRYGGLRATYTGRGSLGFQWMESLEEASGVTQRTEYRQDWPYIGSPTLVRKLIAGGVNAGILYEANYSYACKSYTGSSCGGTTLRYFPYLSETVERSWDLNGSVLPEVTTTTQYDNYGNATLIHVASGDGYSKTTSNTFVTNAGDWRLNRLVDVSVTSQAPGTASLTRRSSFTYTIAGLVAKEVLEPQSSQMCVVTAHAYDAVGNRISSTVRNCNGSSLVGSFEAATPAAPYAFAPRTSTTEFDSLKRFPIRSVNALGHEETRIFDPKSGALLSMTGPNGLTTEWQYDPFVRKVLERRSDGTRTSWSYYLCNDGPSSMDCPEHAVYSVYSQDRNESGEASGPELINSYDVAGRIIRVRRRGFDGWPIETKTIYDALGRIARSSRPYRPASQAPAWTNYNYDAVGRLVSVLDPNGGLTITEYNGLITSVTNARNQTEVRTVNSQGQLVTIRDANGRTLTFSYDAYGNLIRTLDPDGNMVSAAYNLRGHKTQSTDPDLGTWLYVHNALGELVKQTDAKSQITNYEYDLLGRMTRRSEADLNSTWHYDKYPGLLGLPVACGKSVGKLCRASSDNNYDRTYRYDNQGRPDRVQTAIGLTTYTMEQSYDSHGRVSVVDYPTLFGVKYIYTSYGFLSEIRNKSTNALYWKANAMDAEGNLLQQTYGNNVVTHQAFEASTGNLQAILAGNGGSVQNLTYQYDSLGNVLMRSDNNQLLNETFGYDSLNRLEFSSVNSPSLGGIDTTRFEYSDIGNITNRSDVGTYEYHSGTNIQKPHAVKRVLLNGNSGSKGYLYDANGNMTLASHYDGNSVEVPSLSHTVAYTSYNLPRTITRGGVTLDFVYGPEHQRVTQKVGNVTTTYVHPDNAGGLQYEKEVAPTKTEQRFFVTALGQVVAIVKKNGLGSVTATQYWHRDALGSVTAITNESGTVVERLAYEPFGKRRTPQGGRDHLNALSGGETNRGYTGHEHLDDIGLIHMNGRVYDPVISRFMTADPIIQDGQGLQSYNRYSYTINNPLVYTDPSGFSWWGKQVNRFGNEVGRWERDFRHEIRRPNSLLGPILRVAGAALAIGCGPGAPACVAAVVGTTELSVGRAQGVTGTDLLRNAAIAAASAAAFSSIGDAYSAGTLGSSGRYAAHSAVGCFRAAASGGNCGQGAAASFLGVWSTVNVGNNIVVATVAGGLGSRILGGRFVDGAITAAFGYLLNEVVHRTERMLRAVRDENGMIAEKKFPTGDIKWVDAPNMSALLDSTFGEAAKLLGGLPGAFLEFFDPTLQVGYQEMNVWHLFDVFEVDFIADFDGLGYSNKQYLPGSERYVGRMHLKSDLSYKTVEKSWRICNGGLGQCD